MNKLQLAKLAVAAGLLAMSSACSLDPLDDDWNKELYTRNFIKDFGLIDSTHDWNLAENAVIKVNVGSSPVKSLKIYAKQGSKYYLVANLDDVQGALNVPVDVPKGCDDVLFIADGSKYHGHISSPNNLATMSRGDLNDQGKYNPWDNTNPQAGTTLTSGGYTLTRKYTASGTMGSNKEYQYFNTQQMSPIISNDIWEDYYSLNLGATAANENHETGLLPESGDFTRTKAQITDHINAKRAAGHTMTYDFTVTINDGALTFYPYYYGTNYTHDLGIYLLDENGKPILKDGGTYNSSKKYDPKTDFVSFKIFEDRMTGDLQTQPHYYNDIESSNKIDNIKVKAKKLNKNGTYTYLNGGNYLDNDYMLELKVGDKVQFEAWAYHGETLVYSNTSDNPDPDFESTYNTRFSYHVWDYVRDESIEPVRYAEIDKDGLLTALCTTTELKDKTGGGVDGYYFMDITIGSELKYPGNNTTTLSDYTGVTTVCGNRLGFRVQVSDKSTSSTIEHKHTEEISTNSGNVPEEVSTIWSRYFSNGNTNVGVDDENGTDRFSAPSRAAGGDLVLWEGSVNASGWDYKFTALHKDNFSWESVAMDNYESIQFEFTELNVNSSMIFAFSDPDKGYWHVSQKFSVTSSPWTLNLDDTYYDESNSPITFRDRLPKGFSLLAPDGSFTITKVTLIAKNVPKNSLAESLEEYHAAHRPATCDRGSHASHAYDFTDANVKVTFANDASASNVHYTVTWSKTEKATQGASSAPRRNARSRADKPAALTEGNAGAQWKDVNAAYTKFLPLDEELSSYPHSQPMLGRTRGYDIFIKDSNDQPFNGKVGMYLTIKDLIELDESYSESTPYYSLKLTENTQYTLYSQNEYNKAIDGSYAGQIAAISFKHPASGRTFFSFEDRRVANSGSTFSYWDDSSDRDLNDMIFLLSNYDAIEGQGDKITENDQLIEDGFSWIWAVEDLGAKDDFDFNDLVVKIQSITQTNKHTSTLTPGANSEEQGGTTTTYSMMYKKVTFTPLCAGGALPLFINLKVGNDVYVLRPGAFRLNAETKVYDQEGNEITSTIPLASGLINSYNYEEAEVHKWFGNYSSRSMINTGLGVSGARARACEIYVPAPSVNTSTGALGTDGFSINFFNSSTGSVLDNYDITKDGSGHSTYFYISVDREGELNSSSGALLDGQKATLDAILNTGLGAAPQSFIINADNWRWPIERTHMLTAYPTFTNWVKDKTNGDWYTHPASGEVYIP